MRMTQHPTWMAHGLRLLLSLTVALPCLNAVHAQSTANAQAAASTAASAASAPGLTQAQVKAQYENCPSGHYTGPRPGKARYTKDPWLWVVTPEFARKFCMPPEFVSSELQGAEAIAYKMVQNQDEEVCGWGDNPDVCRRASEHRFEIYYKNGTIPKDIDAPYFHAARTPSTKLLASSDAQWQFKMKSLKKKPRIGALGVFESQQFGLQSVKGGKIAWPLGTLAQEVYYEEAFEGIDYLAVEGASGFSRLEGWRKSGAKQMVITAQKLNDPRKYSQTPMNEFALVITLPTRLSERLIQNDQAKGLDLQGLAREALKLP
ncbi:hypothetical protein [Limnohabitans planktonicus]|uniref:Uncharacterized protein n=1 Tax=Limnohabitans planktonicus II-D5 TaxID=1293045 RepID=A0A2T7UE72_9BURK|nr:hypothetical protein [Limnohabitans planktonicus]PVE42964.1 hypothetical protein H663_009460 [Limnohabitans planktonicus II-D5]